MKKQDRPNLDALFDDLNHPNPNINRNAFKAMYLSWPDESKERLLKNLNSKDIDIRRKSVKALSYFGEDIIKPVVDIYISTQERILQISCLKVLVKVAASNKVDDYFNYINKVIEVAIDDYSVEIVLGLINLLRQLGPKSIPTLIKIAKDKDILRSRAAVTALGEIPDPKAKRFLEDYYKQFDIDPIVKEGISSVLGND